MENFDKNFENINVEEELKKIQETAKQAADTATELIQKYPLQSVLGAAALGFLLGALLKRDRHD